MSAISIGEARRGDRAKALNRQIASINQQLSHMQGAGGARSDYQIRQQAFLREERERLEGEIARLGNLSNDELVSELCPEVARQAAIEKDSIL
jgi:hypothetical protein